MLDKALRRYPDLFVNLNYENATLADVLNETLIHNVSFRGFTVLGLCISVQRTRQLSFLILFRDTSNLKIYLSLLWNRITLIERGFTIEFTIKVGGVVYFGFCCSTFSTDILSTYEVRANGKRDSHENWTWPSERSSVFFKLLYSSFLAADGQTPVSSPPNMTSFSNKGIFYTVSTIDAIAIILTVVLLIFTFYHREKK